jgi:hypothetical protein
LECGDSSPLLFFPLFFLWSAVIYHRFCFSIALDNTAHQKTKAVINHRTPKEKQADSIHGIGQRE